LKGLDHLASQTYAFTTAVFMVYNEKRIFLFFKDLVAIKGSGILEN
jgi:hypothetical protein